MSLLCLPNESLHQILSNPTLNRFDLNSLIRTCRLMHEIGIPLLYRNLILTPRHDKDTQRKERSSSVRLNNTFTLYQPGYLSLVQEATLYLEFRNPSSPTMVPVQLLHLGSKFTCASKITIDCQEVHMVDITEALSTLFTKFRTSFALREFRLYLRQNALYDGNLARIFSMPNLSTLQIDSMNIEDFYDAEIRFEPTKITRLEFSRVSCSPEGFASWFKHHPALTTLIWTIRSHSSSLWLGSSLQGLFRPVESRLKHLRLTHEFCKVSWHARRPAEQEHDTQLDFSSFVGLETLEIHEELAFRRAKDVEADMSDHIQSADHYADVLGRLPPNLSDLTIYFDPETYTKKGPMWHMLTNHNWLVLFAEQASTMLKALSTVALIEIVVKGRDVDEEPEWEVDQMTEGVEWEYPSEVTEAFDKAGIRLKVFLNPPVPFVKRTRHHR